MAAESHANWVKIPSIVSLCVVPVFVGLRFYIRIFMTKNIGPEDWTILISLICSMLVSILMIVACDYGFGHHIKTIPHETLVKALEIYYVAQIFYKVGLNLTKISILLLYLRIFINRYYRLACWILIGIISSYCLGSTLVSIFQCTPVRRAFNKTIPGTCVNLTKYWYGNGGFSIATDVLILTLPMPVISTLKLPRKQKFALIFVLALGSFVVVTSILRMTTLDVSTTSPDTTYDLQSSLWTVIEESVAIICACLPILSRPLAALFPRLFGGSVSATSNPGGSGGSQPPSHPRSHLSDRHWYGPDKYGHIDEIPMSNVSVGDRSRGSGESVLLDPPAPVGITKTVEVSLSRPEAVV